jgi:hypothetical protein
MTSEIWRVEARVKHGLRRCETGMACCLPWRGRENKLSQVQCSDPTASPARHPVIFEMHRPSSSLSNCTEELRCEEADDA